MGVVPSEWVEHVEDRLSHDYRYAIDNKKIKEDLNWSPTVTFEEGIQKTIDWYNEKY